MVMLGGCGSAACTLDSCPSGAGVTGKFELGDSTAAVDAKFCNAHARCVTALINRRDFSWGREFCAGLNRSEICFSGPTDGQVEVSARLLQDSGDMPPDGESFTLTLVDHDSKQVIVEQTRFADYETTREDDCHHCWWAAMQL